MLQALNAPLSQNSGSLSQANPSLISSDTKPNTESGKNPETVPNQKTNTAPAEETQTRKTQPANRYPEQTQTEEAQSQNEVSQTVLDKIQANISRMHNIELQFSKHDATGRTIVKVTNKDTGKVIREVPSEKILDMAAKMDEMLGMIYDKKV